MFAGIFETGHASRSFSLSTTLVMKSKMLPSLGVVCAGVMFASAASAAGTGTCDKVDDPATAISISQTAGRATVALSRTTAPRNPVVKVEIEDETYITRYNDKGQASISFALTTLDNTVTVRAADINRVTCRVQFPEVAQLYRVIMRWHDRVRLDLHVVEPLGKLGGNGHINAANPNTQLKTGLGRVDVVTDATEEGATGEQSYVVEDVSKIPPGGVFSYRLDYVTRGLRPAAPYCGENALANVPVKLTILYRGKKPETKRYSTGSIPCGQTIEADAKLQRLRW